MRRRRKKERHRNAREFRKWAAREGLDEESPCSMDSPSFTLSSDPDDEARTIRHLSHLLRSGLVCFTTSVRLAPTPHETGMVCFSAFASNLERLSEVQNLKWPLNLYGWRSSCIRGIPDV